ncbi:hypothetical protein NP233_g770 [Leucocoprinus birnbaumii]|uniref:Uncharacterized protein n=1 Tax=Leucocoprinus birnbaumii TaxID=56174 RepID=A0AAD5YWF8_9AGAR|nr:hypothetical protein NP233_g770 [Leucocoprinus birnbaumii]
MYPFNTPLPQPNPEQDDPMGSASTNPLGVPSTIPPESLLAALQVYFNSPWSITVQRQLINDRFQSLLQDPSVLQPLATALKQATKSSANETVALSTIIANQVADRLSENMGKQVEEHVEAHLQRNSRLSTPPTSHLHSNQRRTMGNAAMPIDNDADEDMPFTRNIPFSKHQLNLRVQDYLKRKKIWGKRDPNEIPSPPALEDVIKYQEQQVGCPGPSADNPRFFWERVLSNSAKCRWNHDLLYLLAHDLRTEIHKTLEHLQDTPRQRFPSNRRSSGGDLWDLLDLDPTYLTVESLKSVLERRISGTRHTYFLHQPPPPGSQQSPEEKKKYVDNMLSKKSKRDRALGRRRGLFKQRKNVIEKRRRENEEIWSSLEVVVQKLGVHGMSEDETDCEGSPGRPKEVRRLRTNWRNVEITALMDYIDVTGDGRLKGAGNASYYRHKSTHSRVSASPSDPTKGVPRGLPENYYDMTWCNALSEGEVIAMRFKKEIPLPSIDAMHGVQTN